MLLVAVTLFGFQAGSLEKREGKPTSVEVIVLRGDIEERGELKGFSHAVLALGKAQETIELPLSSILSVTSTRDLWFTLKEGVVVKGTLTPVAPATPERIHTIESKFPPARIQLPIQEIRRISKDEPNRSEIWGRAEVKENTKDTSGKDTLPTVIEGFLDVDNEGLPDDGIFIQTRTKKLGIPIAGLVSLKLDSHRPLTLLRAWGRPYFGRIMDFQSERFKFELLNGQTESLLQEDTRGIKPLQDRFWKFKAGLDVGASNGNSDSWNTSGSIDVDEVSSADRGILFGRFKYREVENQLNARSAVARLQYDVFFRDAVKEWKVFPPRQVYGFLSLDFWSEQSRDVDLELRSVPSMGLGWQFIEHDDINGRLDLGVGFLLEDWDMETAGGVAREDVRSASGRASARLIVKFIGLELDIRPVFFLMEGNEYRAWNEATLKIPIEKHWALTIRSTVTVNSDPFDQQERTDRDITIGIEFKT